MILLCSSRIALPTAWTISYRRGVTSVSAAMVILSQRKRSTKVLKHKLSRTATMKASSACSTQTTKSFVWRRLLCSRCLLPLKTKVFTWYRPLLTLRGGNRVVTVQFKKLKMQSWNSLDLSASKWSSKIIKASQLSSCSAMTNQRRFTRPLMKSFYKRISLKHSSLKAMLQT